MKESRPTFHLIAGPNGAGKTTFAKKFLPAFAGSCEFINADIIAAELSPGSVDEVTIKAGRIALTRMRTLIAARQDFAFETTLSARSYVNLVSTAKDSGYLVRLYFLWLPSPDDAVKRVASRVKRGGHSIPEATIRRRYTEGLSNFFKLYSVAANEWTLFHSSSPPPILIAHSRNQVLSLKNEPLYNQILSEVKYGRGKDRER